MKIAILYVSVHHGNTRKIAELLAQRENVETFDILRGEIPDLTGYDGIGFASGIYFNAMHPKIRECIREFKIEKGQKVFLLYTCGIHIKNYVKREEKILKEKGADYVGKFCCRGFDTYGILRKIGGIAKNRPNEKDFEKANGFFESVKGQIKKESAK